MIHHVAVDVPGEQVDAAVAFWALLGFDEIEPPDALRGTWRWVERGGGQIHLRAVDGAGAADAWHVAVVVGDYDEAARSLAADGFDVVPGAPYWGAPRAKTTAPGGVVVEFVGATSGSGE